jgi:hypothetical protein
MTAWSGVLLPAKHLARDDDRGDRAEGDEQGQPEDRSPA